MKKLPNVLAVASVLAIQAGIVLMFQLSTDTAVFLGLPSGICCWIAWNTNFQDTP